MFRDNSLSTTDIFHDLQHSQKKRKRKGEIPEALLNITLADIHKLFQNYTMLDLVGYFKVSYLTLTRILKKYPVALQDLRKLDIDAAKAKFKERYTQTVGEVIAHSVIVDITKESLRNIHHQVLTKNPKDIAAYYGFNEEDDFKCYLGRYGIAYNGFKLLSVEAAEKKYPEYDQARKPKKTSLNEFSLAYIYDVIRDPLNHDYTDVANQLGVKFKTLNDYLVQNYEVHYEFLRNSNETKENILISFPKKYSTKRFLYSDNALQSGIDQFTLQQLHQDIIKLTYHQRGYPFIFQQLTERLKVFGTSIMELKHLSEAKAAILFVNYEAITLDNAIDLDQLSTQRIHQIIKNAANSFDAITKLNTSFKKLDECLVLRGTNFKILEIFTEEDADKIYRNYKEIPKQISQNQVDELMMDKVLSDVNAIEQCAPRIGF